MQLRLHYPEDGLGLAEVLAAGLTGDFEKRAGQRAPDLSALEPVSGSMIDVAVNLHYDGVLAFPCGRIDS